MLRIDDMRIGAWPTIWLAPAPSSHVEEAENASERLCFNLNRVFRKVSIINLSSFLKSAHSHPTIAE